MNEHQSALVGDKSHFVMTDYLFLLGMWLVVFWAVDPFRWRLSYISYIKHFPLIAVGPAFVLVFAGNALFKRGNAIREIDANSRLITYVLLFGLFVTAGSLYARFANGINNTFLTMGIYSLTAPLTFWFIRQSGKSISLVKGILFIYLFWGFVATVMQMINYNVPGFVHEKEHLVIGILSMLYFLAKTKLAKFVVIIFLIFVSILINKNTAYLIMLLVLGYAFFIWCLQHTHKFKDGFLMWAFWIRNVLISILASTIVAITYFYLKSSLPTGNPVYRQHAYERAWNKFLSSPIWGNGFTQAGTEKFDLYKVASTTQVLPTHSDILDILANGGLIAFLLFLAVFIGLFKQGYLLALYPERQRDNEVLPYLHTMFCMVFSGVIVCSFNPIMNSPGLAWTFWMIIGALIAILKIPAGNISNGKTQRE